MPNSVLEANTKLFFFAFLFAVSIGVVCGTPMRSAGTAQVCQAVQTSLRVVYLVDNVSVVNLTATVSVSSGGDLNAVTLTTNKYDTLSSQYRYEHYLIGGDVADNTSVCNTNLPYCSFLMHNGYFSVYTYFVTPTNYNPLALFDGFVDMGAFNLDDGNMMQPTCMDTVKPDRSGDNFTIYYTSCCTSYMPVQLPPKPVAKCEQFRSSAIYYGNGMVAYGSIKSTLKVQPHGLAVSGVYDGFPNQGSTSCEFIMNNNNYIFGYGGHTNLTANFTVDLSKDGKHLFRSMQLHSNIHTGTTYNTVTSGRIIVRDGVFYMTEGRPFTPQDECLYARTSIPDGTIATSEFCCQSFVSA